MKILLINAYLNQGGASKSTYRLFGKLKERPDTTVKLFVTKSNIVERNIVAPSGKFASLLGNIRSAVSSLVYRLLYKPTGMFSVPWMANRDLKNVLTEFAPDVIHVNWLDSATLSLNDLEKSKIPVIWTMHDSWLMTGGCHVPDKCDRHAFQCGQCPTLKSKNNFDLSRLFWKQKASFFKRMQSVTTITAPSKWLYQQAKQSPLLPNQAIYHVPNGIDHTIFKPFETHIARRLLNIPENKSVITIAGVSMSSDKNKGLDLIEESLKILTPESRKNILILIIGSDQKERTSTFCGFSAMHIGMLHDDVSIALYLSASDVFCIPSRSENFPNALLEALSCGIPSVGFSVGGIPDIIQHKQNGYLAKPYSPGEFAAGIEYCLGLNKSKDDIAQTVSQFSIEAAVTKYQDLYLDLINRTRART
ncbi:glycosyltransferase [Bdellovibrio sp. HCB2-146]|uniref:glycosyltransferase n=1 Tax=Bdellovibrio sp. HCB2-146 TaxID=3394362 RepID=UPI0039BD6C68